MKTARQVVNQVITEWMERSDIEHLAKALRQSEDGILSVAERAQIEQDLRLWEFGKWALLGDTGPGQRMKAVLEYRARVKESPTFWQSIIPLDDDSAMILDRQIAQLKPRQVAAIKCHYQYHMSEDSGARAMNVSRYAFRVARDTALRELAAEKTC